MYGFFLNSNKFISPERYNDIQSGTPIVISNEKWGNFVQFAIYVNSEKIIFQSFNKLEDGSDIYEIHDMSLSNLINNDEISLYEYIPQFDYNVKSVVENAISYMNTKTIIGYSIFGDDFVFACIVGVNKMIEILNKANFGKHYSVNRHNVANYQHHAITIEGGYVVHFAIVDNQNKNVPYITLQSYNKLVNPRLVPYKEETLYDRLSARNRALMAWTGIIYFGEYNLASNNCEHFACWCKTGKHNSKQVKQAIFSLAQLTMSIITRQPNYIGHSASKIHQKYFSKS